MTQRTIEDVKKELSRRGITVNGWARKMGFSPGLVHQVLNGRLKCIYGQSHEIAVILGLKEGLSQFDDLPFGKEVTGEQKSNSK